jgi:cytoskeletal protein RodZ
MDLRDQFRHLLDDEAAAAAPDISVSSVVEPQAAVAPPQPASSPLQKYMPFVFVLIVAIIGFVAYSNRQEFFEFCKPKTPPPTTPSARQAYEEDESGDEEDDEEERVVDTTASVPEEEKGDPMFDPL